MTGNNRVFWDMDIWIDWDMLAQKSKCLLSLEYI